MQLSWLSLVAALAVACGGSSSGKLGEGPSWRSAARETRSSAAARAPAGEPIVLAPARAGARAYNDDHAGRSDASALERALAEAMQEAAVAAGHPRPQADPRLFAVAEELAAIAEEHAPIPYSLVEFAMRHYGVVEPSPHMLLIWGPAGHDDVILERLRERLPSVFESSAVARVGAAVQERGDSAVILLLLQSSFIDIEPIPRRADDGIRIRARVLPPYQDPHVFVTREDGTVSEPTVRVAADGRIVAGVSCDDRRGPQQVEIVAHDDGGSQVLANFPVWCNANPPRRAEAARPAPGGERAATSEQAERLMVELVNRDRADAGLSPLAAHAGLAAVARAHSQEMRDTGVVAHVSPTTGSAADRVRTAGIRTAVVLENVARAYGVDEAEQGLMNSPGHRANILARDVTHVGVGVVFGEGQGGHREMFVTQVFMNVPRELDARAAQRELVDTLGRRARLIEDPALSKIAQQFAAEVAAGAPSEQAAKRATKRLDDVRDHYARVTTIVNAVAALGSFPVERAAEDGEMTHVGVGVAQGPHDVIGDRAIYVVVLLGERR